MSEITITRMRLMMVPINEERGHMAAKFNAQFRGICLNECRIIRAPSGKFEVRAPHCAGPRGNGRGGVRFVDMDLWGAFKNRALAAYEAASGTAWPDVSGDDSNLRKMLASKHPV